MSRAAPPENDADRNGLASRPARKIESALFDLISQSTARRNSARNTPEEAVCDPLEALDPPNASGAIPPLPLAIGVKRSGASYHQFWRQGDVAIYRAEGKGNRLEFEVIKIQILLAEELVGRSYPVREAFPKNSEWGELGFTYTNNSHRDPKAAALAKAFALRANGGRQHLPRGRSATPAKQSIPRSPQASETKSPF
jgi:hypothetical protein